MQKEWFLRQYCAELAGHPIMVQDGNQIQET